MIGSAVGNTETEFAEVARKMASSGLPAIEINLSCPNLDGHLFALDADRSAAVVRAVRSNVSVPLGAKLSPNAGDIVAVAEAAVDAGADWLVLTNTALGAGIDLETRRPLLSGTIGGYSGPPLKPIALRCVIEVHRALPQVPIVGLGGVATGDDAIEFLLAGATAVGIGTAHFAQPRAAARIIRQMTRRMRKLDASSVGELVGGMVPW